MSDEKIICRQKGDGEFRPDWCVYEASQESLREHMQLLKTAHDDIYKLRGQLQNCVNHLESANRKLTRVSFDECIESANRVLYETLKTKE